MELNVAIDAAQINKMVAEAILHSTLGETLTEAVRKATENLLKAPSYGAKSAVEDVVDRMVKDRLHELLREEPYRSQIDAAIRNQLTETALEQIGTAAWKALYSAIERTRDRY
jgi:uncharacterized membrane-anchored protein YjiN (DUF445 family)